MDNIKKIELKFYYTKRKALAAGETWELTSEEWLEFAKTKKAIDLMVSPNSGMRIVRLRDNLPWSKDNLCLISKRRACASKNIVQVRDGTTYTTLNIPQWLSALEANKAHQHK